MAKNKGERRRQEPGNEQDEDADAEGDVASPIAGSPACEKQRGRGIEHRDQVRVVGSERVPVVDAEDIGERGKQKIEMKLRGGRGDQPRKAERARQQDDADRQLGGVNRVGNDVLRIVLERQRERQRSWIEPRQVGKIHRAHSGEHAVWAEIENFSEMQYRLDVPFRPFAVHRRVESERQPVHADDHQGGKNPPRQKVGQDAAERRHRPAAGLVRRGARDALGCMQHRPVRSPMDHPLEHYNMTVVPRNRTAPRGGMDMETSDEATSRADMRLGPIGQFAVKTVIVAAAIVVSAWIMLDVLDDFADRRMQQFERALRSATSLGGRQFWNKLENQLEQLADPKSDLPPEKKQKILAQIKVISERWRPFLMEAAAVVEGETKQPPKPGSQ
jgi:hypothetical protein